MKKLLVGLLALSSLSVFASDIRLSNLPKAEKSVFTQGTIREVYNDASNLKLRHSESEKSTLNELKTYVESELGRQVIEAKCESQKGVDNGTKRGLESKCVVLFL